MTTSVLILDTYADVYEAELRRAFPDLAVHAARTAADIGIDPAEADVLIAFGIAITDDLMRRATKLAWIQSLATGVDHFLNSPLLRKQTLLTSARGIHGPAMRETVAFLMLNQSHRVGRLARNQTDHVWQRNPWTLLAGKTAAIAGVGLASSAIAELLRAFGMRVVGISGTPRAADGFDQVVGLDALLETAAAADYLISVLPGSAANRHRVDASVFAAMKPSAHFISVGRGETVDEAALVAALMEGRIAGAGLDVFEREPLAADSPLWDMPNVVVCPHIGGYFTEYEAYVLPLILDNMRLFLAGRRAEMRNLVDH
jgi:phosphoglycerate dehydrogenase-like enzyme